MTLPISITFGTPIPAQRFVGYRLLHMAEGGDPHEMGAPAVHNSINVAGLAFTASMQHLSYDINRDNPNFTGERWRSVYKNGVAFTNEQGFEKPGDPRADFVNKINITSPLPKIMRGILCSGSYFRGAVQGDELVLYPGVNGINVNSAMPSAQTVIENNWFFWAVSADTAAASHFSQGVGRGVRIPIFIREPARYPLSWFVRWNEAYLPDPRVFYLRK